MDRNKIRSSRVPNGTDGMLIKLSVISAKSASLSRPCVRLGNWKTPSLSYTEITARGFIGLYRRLVQEGNSLDSIFTTGTQSYSLLKYLTLFPGMTIKCYHFDDYSKARKTISRLRATRWRGFTFFYARRTKRSNRIHLRECPCLHCQVGQLQVGRK